MFFDEEELKAVIDLFENPLKSRSKRRKCALGTALKVRGYDLNVKVESMNL
jgi:hypothetical protein